MAYNKTTSSSQDATTSLTECGICLSEMVNPKALPCLHSFCLECLKEVKHPSGIFLCPLCQEKTVLPPEGVDGFRDNFFIRQLQDKELIIKKGEISKPCVSCDAEGQEIAARCVDCNGFLCQQCVKLHQTINPLKIHSVFTIDDLRSGRIDMSKVVKEENCQKHKDQVLRWFCKLCSIPICRDCTVMDHVRPDHDYTTIESANEAQVKEITTLMENCKGATQKLMNDIVNIEQVETNLAKSADNIRKQLDDEKKAYHEAIERSFKEMMDTLSEILARKNTKICASKKDLLNKKSKLTNAVQVADQVITSGSKHDLASNYSSLCKTLGDLQQAKTIRLSKSFSQMKFRPSQTNRIKIVNMGSVSGTNPKDKKGKLVLEREIGKKGDGKIRSGFGVAVNKTNEIFIADYTYMNMKFFDSHGKFKRVLQGKFENPHDFVMSSCETLQYITDRTGLVHVFNQKGEKLKDFPAISPDGKASTTDGSSLHGLAVDNHGHIVVGNYDQKYISKHRSDGAHICSFKTNIYPWFITVTQQGRIVVCPDYKNTKAEILDHNGKLLHTISEPPDAKSWRPCGCCCSDDGIVYVTSFSYTNEGGIYSFTEDGTYLGCVTTDVIWAQGIAMIGDDRMVVAQADGRPAKIFKNET